jgi:ABC-type antimicrobial peptide transport system permease subunit
LWGEHGFDSVRAVAAPLAHGLPGALPVAAAAAVMVTAAVAASLMPAARASRVDVLQALRSE